MIDPKANSSEGYNILPSCSSFRGSEQEYEDGTNIAKGTAYKEEWGSRTLPWYVPSEGKGTRNWAEKLGKLRERFDRLIDNFCPAECELIQWIIPECNKEALRAQRRSPGANLICSMGGLSREPARLYPPGRQKLVGLFAIKSVQGKPMLGPTEEPIPYRFGFNRYYTVSASYGDSRQKPVPQLVELMQEGGNLLYELPSHLACSLWKNWLAGFSQRNNHGHSLWIDALFELSWQRQRGSPHYTECKVRFDNCAVGLTGDGLFPRLPDFILTKGEDVIPHQNGYPMAHHAKIVDVARASVLAIDEILDREERLREEVKNDSAKGLIKKKMEQSNTEIFVSYSHKDKKFFDELHTHLAPLKRFHNLNCWSDTDLEPGSEWFVEIEKAIGRAKVAILLVSPSFLASPFIHDHEFTPLLEKAEKNGLKLLWVPVRASSYKHTPIEKYQALASPEKPLAPMNVGRDNAWVKVVEKIKSAVEGS